MAFRSLSAKRLPHLLDESRRGSLHLIIFIAVFRIHPLLSGCSASFSSGIVGDDPVLVRDFIRSALYDPNHGYFSQRSGSVGVLEQSIRFNQLQGRKAYMQQLDRIYKQSDISWFTPVELFKPWYAHGIAEAILRTTNLSVPLKIFEIGGGSGTCAKGILDYIMLNAPERIYNNMTYTEALAELYKPLQDPLITRCADIVDLDGKNNSRRGPLASAARNMWAKIFPKPRRCWLPTGCLKDGTSSDYSSYLDAKGDADIFFPTDFWLLERIDHHCSGWRKQHDNSATKKGKKRRTIMFLSKLFAGQGCICRQTQLRVVMAIVENGKVRFLRLLIAVDAEAFNTLVVLVVRMRRMGDKGSSLHDGMWFLEHLDGPSSVLLERFQF
ncbi:unnamed protein product [Rhodiola kirilowii]